LNYSSLFSYPFDNPLQRRRNIAAPILLLKSYTLWHIDPLLGKDLETNNETTAVAMQWHGKHASTTIELLLEIVLCNPLLGSFNSWSTAMEMGLFSV
jgi:hypothetical protein